MILIIMIIHSTQISLSLSNWTVVRFIEIDNSSQIAQNQISLSKIVYIGLRDPYSHKRGVPGGGVYPTFYPFE